MLRLTGRAIGLVRWLRPEGVTGSIPVAPTMQSCRRRALFSESGLRESTLKASRFESYAAYQKRLASNQ
jgi:hypothetical protein